MKWRLSEFGLVSVAQQAIAGMVLAAALIKAATSLL
jgi:hypothetical protein